MKKTLSFLLELPEYLMICVILFYWYSTALLLNPVAIVFMVLLVTQLFFKNKIVGIILPSIMALAISFLFLALMSELSEFSSFNYKAGLMLVVGLIFLGLSALASFAMFYKYALRSEDHVKKS